MQQPKGHRQECNVGHPFERIAMDLDGPFPMSQRGNRHIFVVADYFSKWCEAYPVPTIDAPEIAKVFRENWISHYGAPLELHTDQGRNLESNLFAEMCKLLKISKTRTTAFHPQSHGMVVRFNRILSQHLSKVVDKHQNDWDDYIPLFMLAYRSAICESTHHTSAKVIFGHELRLPSDLEFGTPLEKQIPINEFVMVMRNRQRRTYKIIRNRLHLASNQMKTRYDVRANSLGFLLEIMFGCTTQHARKDTVPSCSRTGTNLM